MKVQKMAAVKLMVAVGFMTARSWEDEKLLTQLKGSKDWPQEDIDRVKAEDAASADLLEAVRAAVESGEEIELEKPEKPAKVIKNATTKPTFKTKPTKKAKKDASKSAAPRKPRMTNGQMSQIDAAFKVLAEEKRPMKCKELVEIMESKGYWKCPGGKTPDATLNARFCGEMKRPDSRIKRAGRGVFELV